MSGVIFYYSFTGKTRFIAENLALELKYSIREISEAKKRSKVGAYIFGCYKALKNKGSKINTVDTNVEEEKIIICSPVWAGNPVPAIVTLLSKLDLKGKKVFSVLTCAGGDAQKAEEYLMREVTKKGGALIKSTVIKTGSTGEAELRKEVLKAVALINS